MRVYPLSPSLSVLALTGALLLGGCSSAPTGPKITPGNPDYAPIEPQALQPPRRTDGSLYQQGYGFSLFDDRKAHQIGDVLTVILSESTRSSKSAETSYDKKSEASIATPTLFGGTPIELESSLEGERSFSGEAESDQSNSLRGSITVTVSEVLPNGILRVRGEKWITLNQGDEYIRLTGLVRPDDIGDDNTVLSTKLADARIAYSGTGDFDSTNRMGWLSRFFNSPWWPF